MSNRFAVIHLLRMRIAVVDYMAPDSRNPTLLAHEDDSGVMNERALNHLASLGSAATPGGLAAMKK